jgi:hypothetical protein
MASRNTKTMDEADEAITRGTSNVFADLGFADAEDFIEIHFVQERSAARH